MSGVHERKRSISSQRFFQLAIEIHADVMALMANENVVPKRYRFLVGVPTAETARNALYNIPAELAVDIHENGIQLSGGGALLRGLSERLEKETGLPVHMSEHPREDVVLGLGMTASSERLLSILSRSGAAELTAE